MNIILIGMPGCGKSTAGVLAAKSLCMQFIDTDLLLQRAGGAKLQKIIQDRGLDSFMKLEEEVLSSLTGENCVISTGGSAVYYARAMEHLRSMGQIVYLRLTYEEMCARIHNLETRGIAMRPGMTLHDLYAERCPLYEKYADCIIDCTTGTVDDTVASICAAVNPGGTDPMASI